MFNNTSFATNLSGLVRIVLRATGGLHVVKPETGNNQVLVN